MPLVPINITGQQYQSRSGQLSNQVTQNFYAELTEDPFGKARYVLQPTPGLKQFAYLATGTSGPMRGMIVANGELYCVKANSLFKPTSSGGEGWLTTGIAGTDQVSLSYIGNTNIIIAANNGAIVYQWNGSTLSVVSDPDLESPKKTITHLNNQIIYQGVNGRFGVSDVGDATSINALNYATAEAYGDDLVRVYAHDERLYLFGEQTIETWWNSGQGNPPFDRVEGGIIQVGLDAEESVASNDKAMFWLGDDRQVYRMEKGSLATISNIAMHSKVRAYATTNDAIGFAFTFEGQEFYYLTFPTQDVTWLFNEKTGWTTMSSGSAGGRCIVTSYAFAHGRHLVGTTTSDLLFEWSPTTYVDYYEPIIRIRDCAPLHGGLYGAPGARIEQNDLRMIMEVGTGADDAYMELHGSTVGAGHYASTPDSASLDVTGDIEIQFKVALDDWVSSSSDMICAKAESSSLVSYQLLVESSTGKFHFQSSPDGTSANIVGGVSSVATGTADGEYFEGKVTLDVDDGAGNRVYKFYTLTGGSYVQLGTTQTYAGTTSIFSSTSPLEVGSNLLGTNTQLDGKVSYVRVYDGIDGTLVGNFDAGDWSSGATWTAATTGETWTLNGTLIGIVPPAVSPSVTLSISDDGGNTFSSEVEADIGAAADFLREVRWNALGSFNDGRILRIKCSDRVFTSIHGASSYIEIGI